MNTLVSFLILIVALVISLFTIPVFTRIFGSLTNVALISTMLVVALIDLSVRIIDLRATKLDANSRLIYPSGGGSFVAAPIWILALVFIGYVIVAI